jgi:hypothetical protein
MRICSLYENSLSRDLSKGIKCECLSRSTSSTKYHSVSDLATRSHRTEFNLLSSERKPHLSTFLTFSGTLITDFELPATCSSLLANSSSLLHSALVQVHSPIASGHKKPESRRGPRDPFSNLRLQLAWVRCPSKNRLLSRFSTCEVVHAHAHTNVSIVHYRRSCGGLSTNAQPAAQC